MATGGGGARRTAATDAKARASKWVTSDSAEAAASAAATARPAKKGLFFDASAMDAMFSGRGKFIMAAGIVAMGGGAYLIISELGRSEPYLQSCALLNLDAHAALADALGGGPVRADEWSVRGRVSSADGNARISYDVTGAMGTSALVTVEATCPKGGGGAWTLTKVEAVVEDTKERMVLVGEPSRARAATAAAKSDVGTGDVGASGSAGAGAGSAGAVSAGAGAKPAAAAAAAAAASTNDAADAGATQQRDGGTDDAVYPTDTREYSWQEIAILGICGAGIGLLGGRLLVRRMAQRGSLKSKAHRGTIYERAVVRAEANPAVAAALGTPLQRVGTAFRGQDMGSFVTGEIDVAGPKGAASVALQAVKQAASAPGVPKGGKFIKPTQQAIDEARWTLTHLEVTPAAAADGSTARPTKPIPVSVVDAEPDEKK